MSVCHGQHSGSLVSHVANLKQLKHANVCTSYTTKLVGCCSSTCLSHQLFFRSQCSMLKLTHRFLRKNHLLFWGGSLQYAECVSIALHYSNKCHFMISLVTFKNLKQAQEFGLVTIITLHCTLVCLPIMYSKSTFLKYYGNKKTETVSSKDRSSALWIIKWGGGGINSDINRPVVWFPGLIQWNVGPIHQCFSSKFGY